MLRSTHREDPFPPHPTIQHTRTLPIRWGDALLDVSNRETAVSIDTSLQINRYDADRITSDALLLTIVGMDRDTHVRIDTRPYRGAAKSRIDQGAHYRPLPMDGRVLSEQDDLSRRRRVYPHVSRPSERMSARKEEKA